ncbi:MAG: hypothetical protein ABI868_11250 [Acidobacteriota bacterium]
MNDFDWPSGELTGRGTLTEGVGLDTGPDRPRDARSPADSAAAGPSDEVAQWENRQGRQILWLPSDDASLDAFASEDTPDDVPAPSSATTPNPPAIAAAAIPLLEDTAEPGNEGSTGSATLDHPLADIPDYLIRTDGPIRTVEPIGTFGEAAFGSVPPPHVSRAAVRKPRTTLLQRGAILAVLVVGVIGGGMAGGYFRRHPIAEPAARRPAPDTPAPPPNMASTPGPVVPPETADGATAAVTAPPLPSVGAPPISNDNLSQPTARPAGPRPNQTATLAPDAAVSVPPRAVTRDPSPPPVVAPPSLPPSARVDATAPAGDPATRDRSIGNEASSPPAAAPIVPREGVEAAVVPPAAVPPGTPDAGAAPTDRVRVTDATPGIAAVADEQRVAAVLKRFTDAYTQLDAPAAKAVWPSVDGRALSRAFDALESQSIAFDDCTVHFAGTEARAACVGNITYVPKIGRRSARTVNRHWSFVMTKSAEGWMITDAQMR